MSIPRDPLQIAIEHHQAGRLEQAAELYRQVLAAQPRHASAMHLLGVVAMQSGQPEMAIKLISDAIRLDGGQASYHTNLGEAYRKTGKLADAEAALLQAIKLQPDRPEPYGNLALVHLAQNNLPAVEQRCRQAIGLKPYYLAAGKLLASTLYQRGDREGAQAACEEVLAHVPTDTDALIALARMHRDREQHDTALEYVHRALEIRPDLAPFHALAGELKFKQQDYAGAVQSLEAALRLQESADTRCQLGLVLDAQQEYEASEAQYQRALELNPAHVMALTSVGVRAQDRGDYDQAMALYDRALALDPQAAPALNNRGMLLLTKGDFAAGWAEYEARLKLPRYLSQAIAGPLWDGSELAGRTLAVVSEQGLGDTLQFVRYVPLLAQRGIRPILLLHNAVRPLLRCSGFDPYDGSALPNFDCQVPLLSLPRIFGTTLETIPANVPYLQADEDLMRLWRERLKSIGGFRVGIVWQGTPTFITDRFRSIPLAAFEPLARVPGVTLVSLQQIRATEQIDQVADRFSVVRLNELGEHPGPFMDSAAVMKNLDLIITSDTAPAHLAGALGVPVWLALSRWPDWRWLMDREDSPWYPTMRLFRQRTAGDWSELFTRIAGQLADEIATPRSSP